MLLCNTCTGAARPRPGHRDAASRQQVVDPAERSRRRRYGETLKKCAPCGQFATTTPTPADTMTSA
ncbi:MAG: hypothetical protein ACRETB_07065, partial [Steroidobacteraceae bacterium]